MSLFAKLQPRKQFLMLFILLPMYFISFSQVTIYGDDAVWGNRTAPCNLITNGSFETDVLSSVSCRNTGKSYVFPNRSRLNYYTLPGWVTSASNRTVNGQQYSYSYMRSIGNTGTEGTLPDGNRGFYFGNGVNYMTNSGVAGAGTAASPRFQIAANGLVTWIPAVPTTFKHTGFPADTSNTDCSTTNTIAQGTTYVPATLSQTVTGLTVGKPYHLEFWVEGESDPYYQYDGAFRFTISGAATVDQWFAVPSVGHLGMLGSTTSIGNSQRYHIEFCAASASVTFTWINYGHFEWNHLNTFNWRSTEELVLDDVILNEVSAGANGSEVFCTTQSKTINLLSELGGCVSGGGVWTRTSGTGGTFTAATGTFITDAVTTNSTFTYTITNNCGTYSSTVTVLQVECSVLPVGLIDFQAALQNNTAQISWATASEQNNKGFEIEKSVNGVQWEAIAFVNTKAINGNSGQRLDYNYADNALVTGKNYYRLKQIDIDGKISYSPVRWINMNNGTDITIYPNPAKDNVGILFKRNWPQGVTRISLLSADGRSLILKSINLQGGGSMWLDISKISSGIYFLQLQAGDKQVVEKIQVIK